MSWAEAFDALGVTIASRHELRSCGASSAALTAAVKFGHLIRVRRDHYALPGTPRPILEAVRVGGRLGCCSAMAEAGLFAMDTLFTHVHVDPGSSRLRNPRDRFVPLNARSRDGVELHWRTLIEPEVATKHSVGVLDALAQLIQCDQPQFAVASIDSALHQGALTPLKLDQVFDRMPQRLCELRDLVDGRAESGQESVLRLIIRAAGLEFEPQVEIPGIGRVDFVIEGCLVVEADSREAHDGWELHVRDRDRDLDLARMGYMSLRPVYRRIMFTPRDVREAILHLLAVNRNFRRTF